ncbi:hypothetical protein HNQ66_004503 [Shinella fusca]|uniref:Toprim domain-containing protein n=1 Tax=Shinella fusca TaxID=544480 RepID=A0A7W7YZL1_9HYPH|nr:hypothetical protein [Shinella fusca]
MAAMPMVSALTAKHLATFELPSGCVRLNIAADADAAGRNGIERLKCRARACGILPLVLAPELGDFNDDLRLDPSRLIASLRAQLAREDATVFLPS